MNQKTLPYLWAMIAVFCWGTISTSAKALLGVYSEMQLLFISSLLVLLFLLILNLMTGRFPLYIAMGRKDYAIMAILGILGTFLYNMFYNYGIHHLTSQEACIINYLWPIMVMFFTCLILKEKMTLRKGSAILISFLGVIIIVTRLDFLNFHPASLSGVLSCILGAICYGIFCALNKKKSYDQFVALSIYYLVTCLLSAVILLCQGDFSLPEKHLPIAATLWNGLIANGAGYLFWNLALVRGNTAKISNLAFLTPFLSIICARIFLKEAISIYSLLGLLVIMFGIFLQLGDSKE